MTRKTYHYDPELGCMVEGPGPRRIDGHSGDGWRFSDRVYSGKPFRAPDGTVIDSRKKHREYMKRNGLTTMDDFTNTWSKQQKEREAFLRGESQQHRAEIRQDVIRSLERLRNR